MFCPTEQHWPIGSIRGEPVIALTVERVLVLWQVPTGIACGAEPNAIGTCALFSRRLNALHETILFFSSFLSVCLGVAAAIFIFRVRTRTKSPPDR